MRDTLEHLVKATVNRRDSNKFLYILNQIDVTAKEDNLEEVFAAWQRALAQYGLTAGSSYAIYNEEAASPFDNEEVRTRYQSKREADYNAIIRRIEQVGVERAYRIVGMLEHTGQMLKQDVISRLQRFKDAWRRKVLLIDCVLLAAVLAAFFALTIWGGYWKGISLSLPFWDFLTRKSWLLYSAIAIILAIAGYVHFSIRSWAANKVSTRLLAEVKDSDLHANLQKACRKSACWWRSIFWPNPAGWSRRTAARLEKVLDDSNAYIQRLNDEYTNPSGRDKTWLTDSTPEWEESDKSEFSRLEPGLQVPGTRNPITSEN